MRVERWRLEIKFGFPGPSLCFAIKTRRRQTFMKEEHGEKQMRIGRTQKSE